VPYCDGVVSANEAVDAFEQRFGRHDGFRRLHAKGWLYRGTFAPTSDAAALTRAAVFRDTAVTAVIRFSNGAGDPLSPDYAADVRGMAVKLSGGPAALDIVAQTAPRFPVRTLARFVDVVRASAASAHALPALARLVAGDVRVLGALKANVGALKPPASYATQRYFAVHAFRWVDAGGGSRFVRYTWEPAAGVEYLSARDAKSRGRDYLHDDLDERLARGPVVFTLRVQIAQDGDYVNDPTSQWPEDRPVIEVGTLEITGPETTRETGGDILVFDPTRVIDGIELSDDPILQVRSQVYGESVRRRTGVARPQRSS
jgi:catalase